MEVATVSRVSGIEMLLLCRCRQFFSLIIFSKDGEVLNQGFTIVRALRNLQAPTASRRKTTRHQIYLALPQYHLETVHVNWIVQLDLYHVWSFFPNFRLAQWSREERQPPIPKSPFTGQLHGHLEKLFEGCRLSMSWYRGTPLPCVFILQYAVSECRLVQRRPRETRDKPTASPTSQVTVSNVDHFRRNNINPHTLYSLYIWNRTSDKRS